MSNKLTHNDLIQLGQALGYKLSDGGVCQGFSCMLSQAVLAKDEETFFHRLHFIEEYKTDFEKLKKDIDEVRQQVKKKAFAECDEKEKTLLEIPAFYEGVELYLAPRNHQDLFFEKKTVTQQDEQKIYPIMRSKKLESNDKIATINKAYAFDKESLMDYFTHLESAFDGIEDDVPLMLAGNNHAVSLRYDKNEKKWLYVDTNDFHRYPKERSYARALDKQTLITSIFTSLFCEQSSHVVFNTEAFFTQENTHKVLQEKLEQFNEQYFNSKSELINKLDKNNMGMFDTACHYRQYEDALKILKHKSFDINQINNEGDSPFHSACKYGNIEIIKEFLKHKEVNINQTNNKGDSPFHTACKYGNIEVVKELLTHKEVNINQTNNEGDSPFHTACKYGKVEVVKELLTHKEVNINQTNNEGDSPFHTTCKYGKVEVVKELLTHKEININQIDKKASPLYYACLLNNLNVVIELLKHKDVQVNLTHKSTEFTPLYRACIDGNVNIVIELLKHKDIEVNKKSYTNTPLEAACEKKNLAVIKELLKHKQISVTQKALNNLPNDTKVNLLKEILSEPNISKEHIKLFLNEVNTLQAQFSDQEYNELLTILPHKIDNLSLQEGSALKAYLTNDSQKIADIVKTLDIDIQNIINILPNKIRLHAQNWLNQQIHQETIKAEFKKNDNADINVIQNHCVQSVDLNEDCGLANNLSIREQIIKQAIIGNQSQKISQQELQTLLNTFGSILNDEQIKKIADSFNEHSNSIIFPDNVKKLIYQERVNYEFNKQPPNIPLFYTIINSFLSYAMIDNKSDYATYKNPNQEIVALNAAENALSYAYYINPNLVAEVYLKFKNQGIIIDARSIKKIASTYENSPEVENQMNQHIVDGLLQQKNIQLTNKQGLTALHLACKEGDLDLVCELLDRKIILLNQTSNKGRSAFHFACHNGNIDVVRKLLNTEGIQPSGVSNQGFTAFHNACKEGHIQVVQELLSRKIIPINQETLNKDSPLILACQNKDSTVALELLKIEGIDVNHTNNNGETALHWACCNNGTIDVINSLLNVEGININQTNNNGDTALHWACCNNGTIDVINSLLNVKGININQTNNNGDTALHWACYNNRTIDVINGLLNAEGININQINNNGETALYLACKKGRKNIVEKLLKTEGIAINQSAKDGSTPLHLACKLKRPTIALELLEKEGIDINVVDDNGNSPFGIACTNNDLTIAKKLLEKKINLNQEEINQLPNEVRLELLKSILSSNSSIQEKYLRPFLEGIQTIQCQFSDSEYNTLLTSKTILPKGIEHLNPQEQSTLKAYLTNDTQKITDISDIDIQKIASALPSNITHHAEGWIQQEIIKTIQAEFQKLSPNIKVLMDALSNATVCNSPSPISFYNLSGTAVQLSIAEQAILYAYNNQKNNPHLIQDLCSKLTAQGIIIDAQRIEKIASTTQSPQMIEHTINQTLVKINPQRAIINELSRNANEANLDTILTAIKTLSEQELNLPCGITNAPSSTEQLTIIEQTLYRTVWYRNPLFFSYLYSELTKKGVSIDSALIDKISKSSTHPQWLNEELKNQVLLQTDPTQAIKNEFKRGQSANLQTIETALSQSNINLTANYELTNLTVAEQTIAHAISQNNPNLFEKVYKIIRNSTLGIDAQKIANTWGSPQIIEQVKQQINQNIIKNELKNTLNANPNIIARAINELSLQSLNTSCGIQNKQTPFPMPVTSELTIAEQVLHNAACYHHEHNPQFFSYIYSELTQKGVSIDSALIDKISKSSTHTQWLNEELKSQVLLQTDPTQAIKNEFKRGQSANLQTIETALSQSNINLTANYELTNLTVAEQTIAHAISQNNPNLFEKVYKIIRNSTFGIDAQKIANTWGNPPVIEQVKQQINQYKQHADEAFKQESLNRQQHLPSNTINETTVNNARNAISKAKTQLVEIKAQNQNQQINEALSSKSSP